jgi:DNA-binding MarR family transcriptional regulator
MPGKDRRTKNVMLTEKGFERLEETLPKWRQAQEDLRNILGSDLWDRLLKETRILTELGGTAHNRQTR